jgi:hypothetical protein
MLFADGGYENDLQGAARHAAWLALMTAYLGENGATKIGNQHEKGMPGDNSLHGLDSRRDKHNNERGVAIGLCAKINIDLHPEWTEQDVIKYITKMINTDIKNGDLIWYLYDPRILNPKAPPHAPSPTPPKTFKAL